MSIASRKLQVGATVVTDFSGRITQHTITDRNGRASSQSRVLYKVEPVVPKSSGGWIDADWFESAGDNDGEQSGGVDKLEVGL